MTLPKDDYASFDQFAPNFRMGYKIIQLVSALNLKSFGLIKIKLWARKVGRFTTVLYGNWTGGNF